MVIAVGDPTALSGQCLAWVIDAMAQGRVLYKRSNAAARSRHVYAQAIAPYNTQWVIWCMSERVWYESDG